MFVHGHVLLTFCLPSLAVTNDRVEVLLETLGVGDGAVLAISSAFAAEQRILQQVSYHSLC